MALLLDDHYMHPIKGFFIFKDQNKGGRKSIAYRMHNHRVKVDEIKPKSHDFHIFQNTVRP